MDGANFFNPSNDQHQTHETFSSEINFDMWGENVCFESNLAYILKKLLANFIRFVALFHFSCHRTILHSVPVIQYFILWGSWVCFKSTSFFWHFIQTALLHRIVERIIEYSELERIHQDPQVQLLSEWSLWASSLFLKSSCLSASISEGAHRKQDVSCAHQDNS